MSKVDFEKIVVDYLANNNSGRAEVFDGENMKGIFLNGMTVVKSGSHCLVKVGNNVAEYEAGFYDSFLKLLEKSPLAS